jgi:hypothetical protein
LGFAEGGDVGEDLEGTVERSGAEEGGVGFGEFFADGPGVRCEAGFVARVEDRVGEADRAALSPDEGEVGGVQVGGPPGEVEGVEGDDEDGVAVALGAAEEGGGDFFVLGFGPVELVPKIPSSLDISFHQPQIKK